MHLRVFLPVLLAVMTGAAAPVPPIAGDWLTEGGTGVIRIAACANSSEGGFCGRIVGITRKPNEPMPRDVHGASQCGLTILTIDAEPRDDAWFGHVTDPRNGAEYHAELRVNPRGRLLMRGYVAIPLLGQTQVWQRFTGHIGPECRFER
jgi:uncharacterized protein (DUF2147 family)